MKQEKKNSFYKIYDVLQPFVIYYFLHIAVFYLLAFLFQVSLETFGQGYTDYMTAHAETVTGIVSGATMLLAAAPLVSMLRKELHDRRMVQGYAYESHVGQSVENGIAGTALSGGRVFDRGMQTGTIILTVILAVTSSVGLNILLSITGIADASGTFQDVSRRQFGVAFGIGIILYGIVSPLAEEIVFRGVLYNRMRKYYPVWPAIVVSGLFFGLYHGNLVQGIYGSCLGILMAYLYERTGKFLIPVLFHAVANISVYSIAYIPELQDELFQIINCVILLTISIFCIICLEKLFALKKSSQ